MDGGGGRRRKKNKYNKKIYIIEYGEMDLK
jgi:hypothetical protein